LNATIDWNGERNSGQLSAAPFWIAKTVGGGGLLESDSLMNATPGSWHMNFWVESIHGESAGRVRASGVLSRFTNKADGVTVEDRARFEQLWVRTSSSGLEIKTVTVGPFEPAGNP